MSRTKHAVELCALLVDETYGELTSRIFTILLRRGRLTIPLLSKHTRLTPRQLRHGLAVLLQQNLIYFHFDKDAKSTHYEANAGGAYALVRSGKIMEAVESRHGTSARDIVKLLLLLGHTRVGDLQVAYDAKHDTALRGKSNGNVTNRVNGTTEHQSTTLSIAASLHKEVVRLLEVGVIEPVKEHMLLSPSDTQNDIEKELLVNTFQGSTKGTKQKEDLKNMVKERLKALRSENQNWQQSLVSNGKVNGINDNNKRRRNGNGDENAEMADDGTRLDSNLVIRVNHEKCTVLLRNQRLVALAHERLGETTSEIFDYGLRLIEDKISRCQLDMKIDDIEDLADGPIFNTKTLAEELPAWIDAGFGIRKPDAERSSKREQEDENEDGEHRTNGNGNGVHVDEDINSDDPFDEDLTTPPTKRQKVTFAKNANGSKSEAYGDSDDRVFHIQSHLKLLAADKCKFVRHCGSNKYGEWTIDFENMVTSVRDTEIDQMILSNFGPHGHRLCRVLRKVGKLDEKTLPTTALMKQKDIRTKLAEMQMVGIVDIQEVPRDTNRTVNRTIFLWYFDDDRVQMVFLEKLFKAMSRVFQRLDVERRKYADIISITERSDVRDVPPPEYLDEAQLKVLNEWRGKEGKLLTQIQSLDELVGIFRDY